MNLFCSRVITYLKFLCLGTLGTAALCGQDLLNQSINPGGGWVSNSENSSFTIYGEVYQSAQIDIQSPTHTVDLNSTVSLEMIWVEPGTFMMGSPESEVGRGNDETQHEVTLTKGFYLGKYEVTQAQYEAVMNGNDEGLSPTPSNWSNNPNHPVEFISWEQVQVFLKILNNKNSELKSFGWEYVLPTEAQWEYACRAGTSTVYSWGDNITANDARYKVGDIGNVGGGVVPYVEVGSYNSNPWGFYDMHGNVYEYVQDWYGNYSSYSLTDPVGSEPDFNIVKVSKGGSWSVDSSHLRSAKRHKITATSYGTSHGFRLAFRQITEPPVYLNSIAELTIAENQPIGTIVGEFNATDPDGEAITYHLVDGEGDGNNSLFTLDQNGTIKTVAVLDYEAGSNLTIRVQARDELNATTEGNFTVTLTDVFEDLDGDGFSDQLELEAGTNPESDKSFPGLDYGLIAWYPFDGNASDMSGNENHGWVLGAELTNDQMGRSNRAYRFDGDDHIFIQNIKSSNNRISLSVWFLTGLSEKQSLLHQDDRPDVGLAFRRDLTEWGGQRGYIESPSLGLRHYLLFSEGQRQEWEQKWHHAVISNYKSESKLFIDGQLSDSRANHFNDSENEFDFKIGTAWGAHGYIRNFDGSIDDVRVYERPLTKDEVLSLYFLESGKPPPTHTADLNSTVSLEMIWVEPGTFTMGSPETEEGRGNDETQHEVTLTKGFYLGKYEVTQAQYEAVMTGNDDGLSPTPSYFNGYPDRPVEQVSWNDVQVFLERLNEQAADSAPVGWAYVLPTEAQWEYACRAGTTTAYSWGDTANFNNANYGYNQNLERTADVGGYSPNLWGFFDMHGNVMEWVADKMRTYADSPILDPLGPSGYGWRVLRGGSWAGMSEFTIRSAERHGMSSSIFSSDSTGFRLAFKQITEPPINLNSVAELTVSENQPIGTIVGEFTATDPDGDEITYHLVSGEGDGNNSLFTLDTNGTLRSAEVFDFEQNQEFFIRVQAKNESNQTTEKSFVINVLNEDEESDNHPPTDLNSPAQITVKENGQVGASIGSFTAVDPDGDPLTFFLTEGEGDEDNQFFELSRGGSLITQESFNFEEKATLQIRVGATDGRGGQVVNSFEVTIIDQNDFPTSLDPIEELMVQENQAVGTEVGQFQAMDEDGDSLTFRFARGPGDHGNESFTLSNDGVLTTAREFDFEQAEGVTVRVSAVDGNGGSVSASFEVIIQDQFENDPPSDLDTNGVPSVAENRESGTVVAQFIAFDPDGDELFFTLVSGEGDADNGLFALSENGQLTTASVLDFEQAATRSIRVQVADVHGESIAQNFIIRVIDHENEEIRLEELEFDWDGRAGEIGKLKVVGREDVIFGLGQDETAAEGMHLFVIEDDGTLILAENAKESGTFNLTVIISKDEAVLDKQAVTVQLTVAEPEDLLDVDTSDPEYHETALMIRDLAVVRDDQRNGHNPIVSIEPTADGLIVTTAQPHGRKEGDSVVLSGVKGLRVEGIRNWNFMIDGVTAHSFRLLRFGKDIEGNFDGSKGVPVRRQSGTQYQPSSGDFLLGQWTFGHLLGNMVSEEDDPVEFYRHFANQWKNVQTVNGWKSDTRQGTHDAMVPAGELTLANLPFRLLAIGNRIDLFHAKSMRRVDDAGEGRFVFTMTQAFTLPQENTNIWKVHEKINVDIKDFTLIFEYEQPAGDFATLAKWAKDWHSLQREKTGNGFNFDDDYFSRLNELTDRFSKRGAHPGKPNGNPINQVRTNDFIQGIWQMREYNLTSKEKAHQVKALPDRDTKLVVDKDLEEIDVGLWTTTTKNNPMVGSNRVEESIEKPLARWINQRESHILSADVGPRGPEWMEGPIANEPFGFTYTFESENIRTNLARYKFSLSTCTGCHTGDSDTIFQMVHTRGPNQKAFFARFMVGDQRGGMHEVRDGENFEEKHEFFDLKAREEIARDILSVAREVDEARLRLTRTEIELDGLEAPAHAFVSDGVIGDWQYDLPSGREDNDFYTLNASTGELSIRGNGERPPFGKGRIFLRARATDGTGVVIERPYSLWVLSEDESRQMEDLDPSIEASDPPPLATPRPNRTH